VRGFEERTLSREAWAPHASHLVTTAWYCRRLSFDEALLTMREGILALKAAIGVPPEAYHETVTRFFVTLVHRLLRELDEGQGDAAVADAVLARLGTSREERRALAARDWRDPVATLESDQARTGWLPPDLRSLGED
jgi:hypothetical protein